MKKTTIGIGMVMFLLLGSLVVAFDLVESFRLYSTDRQEARIDNDWLVAGESNSNLNGLLVHYPLNDTGQGFLNLYYEGVGLDKKERSVYAFVDIDNVYDGVYGLHFTGLVEYLPVRTNNIDIKYYQNVEVSGFYNGQSRQIYVHFDESNKIGLGETWVTFMQDVIELEVRNGEVMSR